MEDLKNIVNDFLEIKKSYQWIIYYTHAELEDKLDFYQKNIDEIYKKHSVKNYNDLIEIIKKNYSNSKIEKDMEFCKHIIFLIKSPYFRDFIDVSKLMPYDDSIFKEIYEYIIKNNLYNPNWNIGSSEQPLFIMLPISKDLFEVNLLVYDNESIDWNIDNNGSDAFMSFVYLYLHSEDDTIKEYFFNILKKALDKIDNIDETIRYCSEEKIVKYEIQSIREQILKVNDERLKPLLKMIKRR